MNGLFLQGGGAKGAFQAGAIYAMCEKELKFDIISGTSIGAVNGYFVYTNNIEKMKKFYIETDLENIVRRLDVTNVIPNNYLIDAIKNLDGEDKHIKSFYINYVNIRNEELEEIKVNAAKLTKGEIIKYIGYSSLLPYVYPDNSKSMLFCEVAKVFNSQLMNKSFIKEVKKGRYNGLNVDGGILNNNFMQPFIKNHVEKLYLIALHNGFQIPEYLLDNYEKDNIILIQRKTLFEPNDALNYSKEFLSAVFKEGYDAAKEII